MASKRTKLELTWIGKENRPKLEPRILIEDPEKSYHAAQRQSENDIFDNRLIFGDNLLALKALEQEFTGKVKCIYIDPPYNTGSAFEHYDDGVEHSLWLSLVRDRLEILRKLLTKDGSLWVSIDDVEYAYLRVLLDEVFGRANFATTIIWEKRKTRENRRVFSFKHDYVVVYAKNRRIFEGTRNALPMSESVRARYRNPDNDPRGSWQSISALAQAGHGTASQFYTLTAPNGKEHELPEGNCWRYTQQRMTEAINDGRIWFGKTGNNAPRIKKYLSESGDSGLTPETIWYADEVGTTDTAKKHSLQLFEGGTVFDTPKSEELLQRILQIATNSNDIVLDSFAGSGTTGAVTHKMGRRWIMVELEETCHTHIIPRIKKVIDGKDEGGITKAVNWKGGGGFRYYRLGPSLIIEDEWGNPVINSEFNAAMLAEAMCKLEGFEYAPSEEVYWIHGKSTECDFLYVTTQFMSKQMLTRLSDEVGPERSLLICCSAFRCDPSQFPNLTVKKIPKAVLKKCEWGHDDYSLEIKNLPKAPPEPDQLTEDKSAKPRRKFGKDKQVQATLFDMGGEK
ncbi:MAG: site-specific DNA-methyltransferase [Planctomycetota bacterium]|nr:MAG: site-specific DNA-methyltransferase [Planctomycetota bacterium]